MNFKKLAWILLCWWHIMEEKPHSFIKNSRGVLCYIFLHLIKPKQWPQFVYYSQPYLLHASRFPFSFRFYSVKAWFYVIHFHHFKWVLNCSKIFYYLIIPVFTVGKMGLKFHRHFKSAYKRNIDVQYLLFYKQCLKPNLKF